MKPLDPFVVYQTDVIACSTLVTTSFLVASLVWVIATLQILKVSSGT